MTIWFGGDYNPEQWDESVWDDDIRLMTEARVSMVTVGVFSWSVLETAEGVFEFEWLDRVLDKLHSAGIRVDLATGTASPPPWLTHQYPEVLPVTENGVRLQVGSRQQFCPSSPIYRRLAARLAGALAERYADHPALEMWHINNEYGCHLSHCYCSVSADAFRQWLQAKYADIGALNKAWGTAFWSQRYGSFAEIYPPSAAPYLRNPGQLLDFDRFTSDELLDCFRAEVAAVKRHSPDVPVTTNFMGFFKPLNYWDWAAELDVISDDSYPDPADPRSPMLGAMSRDLMRSLADGKPWMLMEQAANAVNWRPTNVPKAPGMMRAWSLQAVARGATGVLYFQWRQSDRGGERFHSAMLPHSGTATRSWREVRELGSEVENLVVADASARSSVAIVLDWNSWWAIEQKSLPARLSYHDLLASWYQPFFELGVMVDFVKPQADLSAYDVVVAPGLFSASPQTLGWLSDYAERRGNLIVSFQSGIADETGRLTAGGYLGELQSTLGVWIDEFAPLVPGGSIALTGGTGRVWSERITATDSEVMQAFTSGALEGSPAVTRRRSGAGQSFYVATELQSTERRGLVESVVDAAAIPRVRTVPSGLEVALRGETLFLANHSEEQVTVELDWTTPGMVRSQHTLAPWGAKFCAVDRIAVP